MDGFEVVFSDSEESPLTSIESESKYVYNLDWEDVSVSQLTDFYEYLNFEQYVILKSLVIFFYV